VFRSDARTRHEFLELIRHRGPLNDVGAVPASVGCDS